MLCDFIQPQMGMFRDLTMIGGKKNVERRWLTGQNETVYQFVVSIYRSSCKMWGNRVLKSIIGVIVPAALVLGALEILFQVVNKVGIVPVPPIPLKHFIHLVLLASQIVIVQFVQVFVGVQAE